MAKIPDAMSLGERRTPNMRVPEQRDDSALIAGQGLVNTAERIGRAALEYAAHDDQFNFARAKSALLQADAGTRKQLENDQDWQTHESRYSEAMKKAREEAGKLIRGSRSRALFDQDAQNDILRGTEAIRGNAKRVESQWGRGELETALEGNRRAALETKDEKSRAALVIGTLEAINGAQAKGYITPEQSVQLRQVWTAQYGDGYVEMLPTLADRLKVLKNPKGTPADYIDPAKRADMIRRTESELRIEANRAEAEARAARMELQGVLRADAADAFAARAMGLPAQLPGRDRFVAAFGKEGADRYAEAVQRWGIYDVVAAASFQPPAEAAATLSTLKPTTQSGAAEGAENYAAATRLYDEHRKALEADPVAVLSQRDPAIQAAAANFDANPEENSEMYFNLLRSKQQALGIAEPKLLPEAQRDAIAAQLTTFDPEKPSKRVQSLALIRQMYGRDYAAVMKEVAPKLDGHGRVLIEMKQQDAERLDAAFAQRETFSKSLPSGTDSAIRTSLQAELNDFAVTMADNPDAEARIAEHLESATLLAKSMVLRGTTPEEAAKQAADAVINSQYNYRGMLRVPKQLDADHVESALNRKQAELAKSADFLVNPMKNSTPEKAQADMRNLVARNGYWITNEDGSGAVLRIPHRGGLGDVFRADGSRVEYSFGELASMSLAGPTLNVEPWGGY